MRLRNEFSFIHPPDSDTTASPVLLSPHCSSSLNFSISCISRDASCRRSVNAAANASWCWREGRGGVPHVKSNAALVRLLGGEEERSVSSLPTSCKPEERGVLRPEANEEEEAAVAEARAIKVRAGEVPRGAAAGGGR